MTGYAQQLDALHQAVVHGDMPSDVQGYDERYGVNELHRRLRVYHLGYMQRLADATFKDYPVLAHAMGEAELAAHVTDYVKQIRSHHRDLNVYSAGLARFLVTRNVEASQCALAELESTVTQVFWMQDSAALSPESLAGLDEEAFAGTVFSLRNAAVLASFEWDANRYLEEFRTTGDASPMVQKTDYLLVYRPQYEVIRLTLEPQEYQVLSAISSGASIRQAIEIGGLSESIEKVQFWLQRWFAHGVFRDGLGLEKAQ